MADQPPTSKATGIQPPPRPLRSERGHLLPRRTSPETSVTLQPHRFARDASLRAGRTPAVDGGVISAAARRNSSDESNETHHSDPKKWFHSSNENPTATYDDPNAMDVDSPFYQQETDSSNELELPPRIHTQYGRSLTGGQHLLRPPVTRQSSSADDYRSVIDDLTIENKRLKEELKRYKQSASNMMNKDKLFEIKVHGLPNGKKRELEATLRDFAASLEGSSETASHERRTKPGKHMKNLYAARDSMSKHASSSSTNSRPVDSAYASMSTGPSTAPPQSSTGQSGHSRPSLPGLKSQSSVGDQKVQSYLFDTPQGLLPRQTALTEREKKKLVVRRLEQLFTGKISGRNMHRDSSLPYIEAQENLTDASAILQTWNPEAVREARIQSNNTSAGTSGGNKSGSRDLLTSNSGSRTEHGAGDSSGSRSGNNDSPDSVPPEQRPTRPRDLDPDRVQVPGENIDYIRHLGIVKPEFLVDKKALRHDVAADADGWVYLNLLANLAQLHMINVTPAFIRSAVSEKSTKFQLSPDGRKIRWRGGIDGTKFSSDSSADNASQKSPSTDEDDRSTKGGEQEPRKKRKTSASTEVLAAVTESRTGSGSRSLLGQVSASSHSFHYKPMFVRQGSPVETSSSSEAKASQASLSVLDEKTPNKSPWDVSGSGLGQRKKRRHDGAIIYYSGAPFCTDLSGDRGDISPTTYMTSSGQERDLDLRAFRPIPHRSWSGSSMLVRPLSDDRAIVGEALDMDLDDVIQREQLTDDDDSAIDLNFEPPWCDHPTSVKPITFPLEPRLEPCGLGGVMPEDHFAVVCHTRHPVLRRTKDGKLPPVLLPCATRGGSEELLESVAGRLASMSTSSPAPPPSRHQQQHRSRETSSVVEMTYLSGRMRRLDPVPLPPPAMFIPPLSSDSSSDAYDDELSTTSASSGDESDEVDVSASESLMSKLGNPRLSEVGTYPELEAGGSDSEVHEGLRIGDLAGNSSDRGMQSPVAGKVGGGGALEAEGEGEGRESGYSSSMEDEG
ncbi:frequency clock protein [Coniochaeta sp. 2T2.1]|nr:frequency clock protein [Coniochaeta sp. 2T2.1]